MELITKTIAGVALCAAAHVLLSRACHFEMTARLVQRIIAFDLVAWICIASAVLVGAMLAGTPVALVRHRLITSVVYGVALGLVSHILVMLGSRSRLCALARKSLGASE